jgi:hypothetical protein
MPLAGASTPQSDVKWCVMLDKAVSGHHCEHFLSFRPRDGLCAQCIGEGTRLVEAGVGGSIPSLATTF